MIVGTSDISVLKFISISVFISFYTSHFYFIIYQFCRKQSFQFQVVSTMTSLSKLHYKNSNPVSLSTREFSFKHARNFKGCVHPIPASHCQKPYDLYCVGADVKPFRQIPLFPLTSGQLFPFP